MDSYAFSPDWEFVADGVMGGVSKGRITSGDKGSTRLRGTVSLDNNGGFIQMAFDLSRTGGPFDASAYTGIRLTARGNGERYEVGLRTTDLQRPWQSYRAGFVAAGMWQTITLPFSDFTPNRTETSLNAAHLRRIGILAYGRVFEADVSIGDIGLF